MVVYLATVWNKCEEWQVIGVFSTEELAVEAVQLIGTNYDHNSIIRYKLDSTGGPV